MDETIAYLGLVDDDQIDILTAALELSALDHQDADIGPHLQLVLNMAHRALEIGAAAVSSQQQAEILSQVIGREYGFIGDQHSYDAPVNADMIRVFDRRKGLPVSLSIIYIAVAARAGWQAGALGLPGHVAISMAGNPPYIIDPFEGGIYVEPARLMMIMAQHMGPDAAGTANFFMPMANREILVRLLQNQASRAEKASDAPRALEVFRRITCIAPGHGAGWWDLARLQLSDGRIEDARQSLSAMLEVTRDPQDRARVGEIFDRLAGR